MAEQKHTHVAVHAIVYNDEKGNRVEIDAGSEFTPNKADLAHLEGNGAIKKIVKQAAAAEESEGEDAGKKK